MSEGNKDVAIIVLQYSVVVKGIERKLNEAGYQTSVIEDDLARIEEFSRSSDILLFYLPGDVTNKLLMLEKVSHVCENVKECRKNMILIGEPKDRQELTLKAPVVSEFAWLDRPVEINVLEHAIENVIAGKNINPGKKNILIVDDDPSYAKMIREWVKGDYQTNIVTAGMQAITFLLKNHVDLILLDYEMPIVDGPQVLQMLRQEPATAKIPVIFLTGVGTKEAVERVMQLKPSGYILKTTSRDDLLKYLHGKLG